MGEKRNAGREPRSDAVHVVYGIGGYNSEGMKSDNPYAGIHLVETARTLDLNGGNPSCNQGGVLVLEKSPTLKAYGTHAVFMEEKENV